MGSQHWIRDDISGTHPRRIITHCGREGYAEGADEYSTVNGERFEAYAGLRDVTCKRCLKSAERNGPVGLHPHQRQDAPHAG